MTALVKADNFDLARCLEEVEEAKRLGIVGHQPPSAEFLASDTHRDALAAAPRPMPIAGKCRRDFTAVHTSGLRPLSAIIWGIIHDEEAPSALSAAKWFENRAAGGSAHLCVDGRTCYRTLSDSAVCWGAPGANYHGLHFEQAGYAHWTRQHWLGEGRETIRRCAYKLALHSDKYDYPLRLLTPAQLRAGFKGVTTHARVTIAFGGTHTDPGTGYPLDILLRDARNFRAEF